MRRPGTTISRPTKRTSPRPAMKPSATLSEAHARASWPLPEPTLAYFPNARFVPSDRDQGAGAAAPGVGLRAGGGRPTRGGVAVADDSDDFGSDDFGSDDFGHVPVLLERCVDLLTPALTRHHPDGSE